MKTRKTRRLDGPTFRLGAAAALVIASACAAPMLATEGGAGGEAVASPVRCGIATAMRGGLTTFRPWVQTTAGGVGSYRFVLAGPGTAVTQDGGFEAGPARPVTLGEAVMQGPTETYDAELTVTLGGVDYTCRADAADI